MPKSRVRKKKNQSRSATKRNHTFSGLSPEMLAGLMEFQVEDKSWLSENAREVFEDLLESKGPLLYEHAMLLADINAFVPRAIVFSPDMDDEEGREWQVEFVRGALPAFGWNSIPAVQERLVAMAAEPPFMAVTALCFVCPMMRSLPGYFTICVLATGDGDVAVAGLLSDSYRLMPPSAVPVERMLRFLFELSHFFDADLFKNAVSDLKDVLAEPGVEPPTEQALVALLQQSMTPVSDRMAHSVELLVSYVGERVGSVVRRTRADVLELMETLEKNHTKQLKKVRAQLDKAEMMAKGSQARADRMAEELKALRKQAKAKPAAQPVMVAGDSLAQALERLFA